MRFVITKKRKWQIKTEMRANFIIHEANIFYISGGGCLKGSNPGNNIQERDDKGNTKWFTSCPWWYSWWCYSWLMLGYAERGWMNPKGVGSLQVVLDPTHFHHRCYHSCLHFPSLPHFLSSNQWITSRNSLLYIGVDLPCYGLRKCFLGSKKNKK